MATRKQIKQFLKERGMTSAFTKWKSIKPVKKKTIEVRYENYDGTVRRGKVYVFKQKNKTVFRDFNTLNIVGKSKKKIPKALESAFGFNKKTGTFKVRGWDVKYGFTEPKLKLKNTSKTQSYNSALQRLRTVEKRNTTKNKSMGMIVTDLTYVAANGDKKRIQIRSRSAFLNKKATRSKLIEENIANGSGLAGFSPVDIIINTIWFEYWSDKREKLKQIR